MANYYCKYCGTKASSVSSLTGNSCSRHPDGPNRGKHALYEGQEKSQYTCKYCGTKSSSLGSLTGMPAAGIQMGQIRKAFARTMI